MEQVKFLNTIIKLFKFLLIIAVIFFVLFLIYQDFVPSGVFVAKNTIEERSAVFSEFYPDVCIRDKECNLEGDCWQTMICDPLYFDVTLPRNFDTTKVIIKYQNLEQKIFQVGLREQDKEWGFQLKPIENQIIDQLDWLSIEENNKILLQKEKHFESIEEFLNNLPYDKRIALFHFYFDEETLLKFKTQPVFLTEKTNLDEIDYIIANYKKVRTEDSWKVAETEFDVPPNYIIDRKLKFMLSAPEMDFNRREIKIKEIEVISKREAITKENLWPRFKNYIIKLFNQGGLD